MPSGGAPSSEGAVEKPQEEPTTVNQQHRTSEEAQFTSIEAELAEAHLEPQPGAAAPQPPAAVPASASTVLPAQVESNEAELAEAHLEPQPGAAAPQPPAAVPASAARVLVGICWRREGAPAIKGAMWDHIRFLDVFQRTFGKKYTEVRTCIVGSPTRTDLDLLRTSLGRQVEVVPADDVDLIVVPGEREVDEARQETEEGLVKKYFGKKPIILICGSVRRLQCLGFEFADVKDHKFAKMVSLNDNGTIVNNALTQFTYLEKGTAVAGRLRLGSEPFPCNSVHNFAPRVPPKGNPKFNFTTEVVARSGDAHPSANGEPRKNRASELWEPEACIEALTLTPQDKGSANNVIMAFLWHPEAFTDEPVHGQLLSYPLVVKGF